MVEVLDDPPLIDAAMLELTRGWPSYYACSWGQALDAAVPAGVKKHAGTRVGTFLVVPEEAREALTERDRAAAPAKQAEVLAILCRGDEPLSIADVCRMAQCAPGRSRPCGGGARPHGPPAAPVGGRPIAARRRPALATAGPTELRSRIGPRPDRRAGGVLDGLAPALAAATASRRS